MGIRFNCPNGHKLNVKEHLAGKRAVCPNCGAKVTIPPAESAAVAANDPIATTLPAVSLENPSVVIPVIDAPIAPAIAPAAISVNPTPSFASAATIDPASVSAIALKRRKRRRTQAKIAIALMATVIVLAIVLVYVLMQGTATEAPADAPAVSADVQTTNRILKA